MASILSYSHSFYIIAPLKLLWLDSVKDILLINVSGQDKPGVTSVVTGVLSRFDVTVLDIGQAVIHDQLTLGILAAVPKSGNSEAMIGDMKSELLTKLNADKKALEDDIGLIGRMTAIDTASALSEVRKMKSERGRNAAMYYLKNPKLR